MYVQNVIDHSVDSRGPFYSGIPVVTTDIGRVKCCWTSSTEKLGQKDEVLDEGETGMVFHVKTTTTTTTTANKKNLTFSCRFVSSKLHAILGQACRSVL